MATATSPPDTPVRRAGAHRAPRPRPRARSRSRLRNWLLFAVLAGPNIALLVIFTYRPLLQSFYLSTLQWNLGSLTARPVGLANYADFFADPGTPRMLAVTTIFTIATVGGGMVLGLLLARAAEPEAALPGRRPHHRRGPVCAFGRCGRVAVAVRVRPEFRRAVGVAAGGRHRLAGLVHRPAVGARDGHHRVPVEERRVRRAHLSRRLAGSAPGPAGSGLARRCIADPVVRFRWCSRCSGPPRSSSASPHC